MSGMVAAQLLAERGERVTVLEPGPLFGGVNAGMSWEGFSLDYGCHVFGNESDRATALLLGLLGGGAHPVHLRFASIFNRVTTAGFELPALDSYGRELSAQALLELLERLEGPTLPPKSLQDLLENRYGPTVRSLLDRALNKVFGCSSSELAPEAISATTFGRIKLLDDSLSRTLKQIPELDARLAASSQDDPMRYHRKNVRLYPYRSFYPLRGGMLGFIESAKQQLERAGVRFVKDDPIRTLTTQPHPHIELQSGLRLDSARLLWTSGLARLEKLLLGTETLRSAAVQVPMVLYYFAIEKQQETGLSYVNSYDPEDLVFRASVPGSYGQENCPPDQSYVCCEVPTALDRPEWQDPAAFAEHVWSEACRFGVVQGAPRAQKFQKVPVSYKAPRRDFFRLAEPIRTELTHHPLLLVSNEWTFSTTRTILSLQELLQSASEAA